MSTKDVLLWLLNFAVLGLETYYQWYPQLVLNKPEASRRCAAVGMSKYAVIATTNIIFGNYIMAVWFICALVKDTVSFIKLSMQKGWLWEG